MQAIGAVVVVVVVVVTLPCVMQLILAFHLVLGVVDCVVSSC